MSPKDFYVGCTMEKFAKDFSDRIYDPLKKNDMQAFLGNYNCASCEWFTGIS